MNKTFWIVAVIVIAVAAAVLYFRSGRVSLVNAPSANLPSSNVQQGAQQLQPSGNPDTIVANLLSDTSALAPTPSEADPSLVASSSDIANTFDQSLDANQF